MANVLLFGIAALVSFVGAWLATRNGVEQAARERVALEVTALVSELGQEGVAGAVAASTPAEITIAARTQSSWNNRSRSRFSSALKKSRFQMLSQSAMPTFALTSKIKPAVSSQATNR
jgi:hypothetical protein